ncbi:MAG: hypothetical protein AAF447_11910 [Myxococcota bacterium]
MGTLFWTRTACRTRAASLASLCAALCVCGVAPAAAQSSEPAPTLPTPEEAAAGTPDEAPAPEEGGDAAALSADAAEAEEALEGQEAEEADEDDEDDDRFRAFYLEASAGYSWINLGAIRNDNLVPDLTQIRSSGYAVGAGFGLWIKFITLGLQAEIARHDGFDFGTAVLDLGIRIPTPFVEPYIRAGLGFAWLFNPSGGLFEDANGVVWEGEQAIRGVVLDVGLGFDFLVNDLVAIGIGADASLFNVRRAGASGSDVFNPTDLTLEEDGDSIGIQVSALLQLSLNF